MATVAHKNLTGTDLHEPKGAATAASGQVYVANGSGSGTWTTLTTPATIPVGLVAPYSGSSAPSGWILCYGQAVSRTTYAALFAITSTTYGVGDGSTTFNLPDLRGRAIFGKDNMGGSTAGRITNAVSAIVGTTLGASGGLESVTLTQANLPNVTLGGSTNTTGNHNHTYNDYTTNENSGTSTANAAKNVATVANTSTDGDHSHTITTASINGGVTQTVTRVTPPAFILNMIIYASV